MTSIYGSGYVADIDPSGTLLGQITDPRVAKNEREHAAAREIERLRAALAAQPVEPTMDTVLRNAARRAGTVVARGRLVQPAEPVADLNPMYRQMWQEQVSLNQQLCAALAAPPAPAAVPPGMALVPIEPTQEMIAAIPFPSNVTPNIAVAAYRAMIAAGDKP